jgi:hypothetical protein
MDYRLYKNKDGSERLMANIRITKEELAEARTDEQGNTYIETFAGPQGMKFNITKDEIVRKDGKTAVVSKRIEALDNVMQTITRIKQIDIVCEGVMEFDFNKNRKAKADTTPAATREVKGTDEVPSEPAEKAFPEAE